MGWKPPTSEYDNHRKRVRDGVRIKNKVGKCQHKKVYRERGPETRPVLVYDIHNDGSREIVEKEAKVVWEVCLKCRRKKEVGFQKGLPGWLPG